MAGPFRVAFRAMGCPCEIQLFGSDDAERARAAGIARAEILRLEHKYSRYREDSLLSTINRVAAAGGRIAVDAETAGLLDYAATCHAQSDGAFDVTSGALRRAWRFDLDALPAPSRIAQALVHVGWHRLRWSSPVLEFPHAGQELDFGGIVKEYAVDRVVQRCRAAGVTGGIVNLGGDLRVIGPRPDGRPWRIGIAHPRRPGECMTTLELPAGAVATSGDYARRIRIGDDYYGHLLDPRSGWPVRHLAAVSVVAEHCVVAGGAATIAMLKGADGPSWLAALALPHLWVATDLACGGSLRRRGSHERGSPPRRNAPDARSGFLAAGETACEEVARVCRPGPRNDVPQPRRV